MHSLLIICLHPFTEKAICQEINVKDEKLLENYFQEINMEPKVLCNHLGLNDCSNKPTSYMVENSGPDPGGGCRGCAPPLLTSKFAILHHCLINSLANKRWLHAFKYSGEAGRLVTIYLGVKEAPYKQKWVWLWV